MHIEHLELFNFRNLERQSLELSRPTLVLQGANAQGKTNLLEALYVCATGKSFRHAPPGEMIRHGAEEAWVRARIQRSGVRHSVELRLAARSRRIIVDERPLRSVAKLLGLVNVVAFFPDDLRVVKGSPEERRRFLDRSIANHREDFVTASLAYSRALRARNALLRSGSFPDKRAVKAYDEQLVRYGAQIHEHRLDIANQLQTVGEPLFQKMMQQPLALNLVVEDGLRPVGRAGFQADSSESYAVQLEGALEAGFEQDCRRGMTQSGPHRSDLSIRIGGQWARQFASQGQQRAIVLALKMAEVKILGESLGTPPILILDDVSSELDRQRTQMLFDVAVGLRCQLWISTTGAAPLPLSSENTQMYEVVSGRIESRVWVPSGVPSVVTSSEQLGGLA